MVYTVTVSHPLYRDVPPMVANGPRDLAELRAELQASGVKPTQIKITGGK